MKTSNKINFLEIPNSQKKTPREKEVRKPGGLLIVRQENTSALLYRYLMVKLRHLYRTFRLHNSNNFCRKDQVVYCPFLPFMT